MAKGKEMTKPCNNAYAVFWPYRHQSWTSTLAEIVLDLLKRYLQGNLYLVSSWA